MKDMATKSATNKKKTAAAATAESAATAEGAEAAPAEQDTDDAEVWARVAA